MADDNREMDPERPDGEMYSSAQSEQPGREDQEAQPSDDEEFEDDADTDDDDDEDQDEDAADPDETEI